MNDRQEWRLKRIGKNIKLVDISKALGVTSAYICMYEKGRTAMNATLRKKYQDYIEGFQHET